VAHSLQSLEDTEEKDGRPQSGQRVPELRFEIGTCRIRTETSTHSMTTLGNGILSTNKLEKT
jgi:hypothetical protein